jgi:hypothetical protein
MLPGPYAYRRKDYWLAWAKALAAVNQYAQWTIAVRRRLKTNTRALLRIFYEFLVEIVSHLAVGYAC